MATTLPRPSRPSNGPPNMALPALPVAKSRKSTGNIPPPTTPGGGSSVRSVTGVPSIPTTPKSSLRAPSMHLGPPTPAPTTALPQPKGLPTPNGAKTLRKSVSINSFPHPPRSEQRATSMPPSPLANEKPRPARRSKLPKELGQNIYSSSSTPSLLNGNSEGKSVRMSDGLISVGSPPQSRSSSAQDSYSTSATTFDDPADAGSQKPETSASSVKSSSVSDKRSSKSEGKGNVLVSVRVRPDSSGNQQNPEGEWMVDGRKSLISYRGKEGGDHTYGKICRLVESFGAEN